METSQVLEPGLSIKPEMTENVVKEILLKVFGLKCLNIKELNGYDDKNYHVQVEPTGDNKYIQNVNQHGYTLKIVNSLDSKQPQLFEAQNEILIHLGKRGICCPKPVQNNEAQYYFIKTLSSGEHIVRLLEYIDGSILHQVPSSVNLFYSVGKYVAQLDEALKSFHHSAYDNHKTVWHLDCVPQLRHFIFAITDSYRKRIIEEVIEEFTKRVLPASQYLEKGMIHGDFNEQNIVVQENDSSWNIKAVLDFGDTCYSCYIYELAIATTYMIIQGKSLDVGGYVLAGYTSIRRLPTEEFNLLKICIAGRLCQTLVMGAYSSLQDPDNPYILTTAKAGWALLEEIWSKPEKELLQSWKTISEGI